MKDDHIRTFLACGLFTGIPQNEMPDIIRAFTFKSYPSDSILIEMGKVPSSLFIIHSGAVGIYNEEVLLTELKNPSCIGESFIAGTTATATSVALTPVEVFEISEQNFFGLADQYASVIRNMFALTIQRLRTSNDTVMREARQREEELNRLVQERTKELQDTLAELKRTQQFRDQFLANMSHEIRTPMNAIVGLTNLLVQSDLGEQQAKYLQVIKKSGDNLLVIINDILDLSKIEAGKMELEQVVFPLRQTMEHLGAVLSVRADQKNIGLEIVIDDSLPVYVTGDETRLTQILMNLTGNAIKFTDKGKVTVSAKTLNTLDRTADIIFCVEDTGIGIPPDKIEKIFESFGQASSDTTRKYGGTGLGLNISKQLIELHNGRLSVESMPGKGSKFYFTIRYEVSDKPDVTALGEAVEDLDMIGRKILLIEDNLFNQMVAEDTIKMLFPDVHVDIAENGRTAIAMASATDYDLLLMDIQLPDIDGYEITKFIRRELQQPRNSVPICALTASISEGRISACLEAGMNDYMMKPFTQQTLKEKITTTIRRENLKQMTRYEKVKQFILDKQSNEFPSYLYYHGIHHVMDVLSVTGDLCAGENLNEADAELIKVAVLFHDAGYIFGRDKHEDKSAQLALSVLPDFGYTTDEIEEVQQLIMATRTPHSPKNIKEQIICDADMDYLGRDDYFDISETLRKEMTETGELTLSDDWNAIQLRFLEAHNYFTAYSRERRQAKKLENIAKIRSLIV